MEFFATPIAAFVTVAAISAGYGLVLLRVVWHYESKINELEEKLETMQNRMNWQQEILLRNFPAEAVNLSISGDVTGSAVGAAGRKVSQ